MASILSTTHLTLASNPQSSQPFLPKLNSQFLGLQSNVGWLRPCRIGPSNGSRAKCWFKFGKNGVDAEGAGIYGSQTRDDFDRDDVEQVLFPSLSFDTLAAMNSSHCLVLYGVCSLPGLLMAISKSWCGLIMLCSQA
jgi:hypothetical protein